MNTVWTLIKIDQLLVWRGPPKGGIVQMEQISLCLKPRQWEKLLQSNLRLRKDVQSSLI